MASLLGIRFTQNNEKYLGNSIFLNNHKDTSFESLFNKIQIKNQSWQISLLSQARRSTLIKSFALAILVYNMFVQQFLYKIIETIDKLFRKFWQGNQEKKIHIIKWSEICRPINEGGIGIRY